MREVLFSLKGWELVRTEAKQSKVTEQVHVCHTKCRSFGYYSVRNIGLCLVCEEKIPDEIVALWCLQETTIW